MLGKSNILILSELLPDLVDFTLLPIFLDHVFTGGSLRASVCVSLRDALETNNSQTTQTKRRETDTETCGPSQTSLASCKFVWSIWLSPFGAALTCSRPSQVCKQHSLYWLFFIFMTSFPNSFAYLMYLKKMFTGFNGIHVLRTKSHSWSLISYNNYKHLERLKTINIGVFT